MEVSSYPSHQRDNAAIKIPFFLNGRIVQRWQEQSNDMEKALSKIMQSATVKHSSWCGPSLCSQHPFNDLLLSREPPRERGGPDPSLIERLLLPVAFEGQRTCARALGFETSEECGDTKAR
jgi:hypothetical protein